MGVTVHQGNSEHKWKKLELWQVIKVYSPDLGLFLQLLPVKTMASYYFFGFLTGQTNKIQAFFLLCKFQNANGM